MRRLKTGGSHRFHRFSQIRTRDGSFDRMMSRRSKHRCRCEVNHSKSGPQIAQIEDGGKPQISPIFTDSDTGRKFRSDDVTTFQTPLPLRSRSPKIRATDCSDRRRGSHRFHRFSQIRTRDGRFDRMILRRSKHRCRCEVAHSKSGPQIAQIEDRKPQIPPIFTDLDTGI